jgi:hypothetical protein
MEVLMGVVVVPKGADTAVCTNSYTELFQRMFLFFCQVWSLCHVRRTAPKSLTCESFGRAAGTSLFALDKSTIAFFQNYVLVVVQVSRFRKKQ